MSDKILERFAASRRSDPPALPAIENSGDAEELGFFGVLRGSMERAVMLELRLKTGVILAVGYSWLERIEYEPSDGIKLFAAGLEILIAGRNLNEEIRPHVALFECLARHRVPWIREADEDEVLKSPETATVVEMIHWKSFKR